MVGEKMKIVGHSLGVNIYHAKMSELEKDKYLPEEFYRNYYCAGDTHGNYPLLEELVQEGIMEKWVKFDNQYYSVTEKGIQQFKQEFAIQVTQEYKPPSKSRQKYLDYLHSDYGDNFSDFLGIQLPKREYDRKGNYRFSSTKYYGVRGDWKPTIKEAKVSYKEKLKEYKSGL